MKAELQATADETSEQHPASTFAPTTAVGSFRQTDRK
jgi:hypothetical protein